MGEQEDTGGDMIITPTTAVPATIPPPPLQPGRVRQKEHLQKVPVCKARELVLERVEFVQDCKLWVGFYSHVETGKEVVITFTDGEVKRLRQKKIEVERKWRRRSYNYDGGK